MHIYIFSICRFLKFQEIICNSVRIVCLRVVSIHAYFKGKALLFERLFSTIDFTMANHVQYKKSTVEKKLRYLSTTHFHCSTIYFWLQFTCTWSGPISISIIPYFCILLVHGSSEIGSLFTMVRSKHWKISLFVLSVSNTSYGEMHSLQ